LERRFGRGENAERNNILTETRRFTLLQTRAITRGGNMHDQKQ